MVSKYLSWRICFICYRKVQTRRKHD